MTLLFFQIFDYMSDLTMSLVVAVFMFIAVEEPFRLLGEMLIKKIFR